VSQGPVWGGASILLEQKKEKRTERKDKTNLKSQI